MNSSKKEAIDALIKNGSKNGFTRPRIYTKTWYKQYYSYSPKKLQAFSTQLKITENQVKDLIDILSPDGNPLTEQSILKLKSDSNIIKLLDILQLNVLNELLIRLKVAASGFKNETAWKTQCEKAKIRKIENERKLAKQAKIFKSESVIIKSLNLTQEQKAILKKLAE